MNNSQKALVVLALGIVAAALISAVTMTYGEWYAMREIVISVTSDNSGDSTQTIAASYLATHGGATPVNGKLYRVTTNPGDGASSPTADWDLVVTDQDGVDILQGACANRSQSSVESVIFANPTAITGAHELWASNMGSTKTATVRLYIGP